MLITEVRVKGEKEHQVLPHEELGRLLERGEVEGVFKYGTFSRDEPQGEIKAVHNISHQGLNGDRPVASSVITSANEDRDGDVVRTAGMLVEPYLKNPVVLPMHQQAFPVGLTMRIKQLRNSAWAQWQWLTDLEQTGAEAFQQLWEAHVLNATSIGFIPTAWDRGEGDGKGWIFNEWELLEFSPVVIPSNREALRTDGIKQIVECYGEMCMAGPSPIAKALFAQGMAETRPKQVAIHLEPTLFGEALMEVGKAGDALVKIEDEPGPEDGDGPPPDKDVGEDDIQKPYPNEHACRLRDPKDFQADSFRRTSRKHDGKEYHVIMGKLKGESKMSEQAYRYPKSSWDAADARKHCNAHDGMSFEAARDYDSLEAVRLAHAAGALTTDEAYEHIERLMDGLKQGVDAAQAETARWKTYCAVLSALVKRIRG